MQAGDQPWPLQRQTRCCISGVLAGGCVAADALSEYEEGKVDADTSIAAAAARAAQASETLRRGAATPAADDADPAIKSVSAGFLWLQPPSECCRLVNTAWRP